MIPVKGSSFGRAGRRRRYPGGIENTSILATVRGSIPKRRTASRWLTPFNLNRKTNSSVQLHALHPPAPAAFRQRPSAAGFLFRRYRTPGRFSEGFLLRRLHSCLPTTSRSADWPHSALSPIGYRRTSLWSHLLLIQKWQRPPSNYSGLGCPRKIEVEVLVVFGCRRTPADYPLNYSAFIGQLGWPNLQNGIGLFSPRQAGQKICPQPEQRTPVLSGSNLCPQSGQDHSPDSIVKGALLSMCHLPFDMKPADYASLIQGEIELSASST